MRVDIYVDEAKLTRIDAYCKRKNISRSSFLTRAAMRILGDSEIKSVHGYNSKKATDGNLCEHGSMKGLCRYGCK